MPTLPKGFTKYGAKLGRVSHPGSSNDPLAKRLFTVACIGPDEGGYDIGGAYWGLGDPVYWAHCSLTGANYFCRAETKHGAKAQVLRAYPNALFSS